MSLRQTLVRQFKKPQGLLGSLAGWVMTHRPSNRERNRLGVLELELFGDARVLELGFGPGLAVEMALQAGAGKVAGLDPSALRLESAQRRNRQAWEQGRLDLRLGSAETLPNFGEPFDRIYSTNVVRFWDDPVRVFGGLKALLAPDRDRPDAPKRRGHWCGRGGLGREDCFLVQRSGLRPGRGQNLPAQTGGGGVRHRLGSKLSWTGAAVG